MIRNGLGLLGCTSVLSLSLLSVGLPMKLKRSPLILTGYGDVAPQTPAGRAFCALIIPEKREGLTETVIIWAIFGVAIVTLLIAVLTEIYATRYKSALVQKGTKRAMSAIKQHRDHMMKARFDKNEQELDRARVERLPYDVRFPGLGNPSLI